MPPASKAPLTRASKALLVSYDFMPRLGGKITYLHETFRRMPEGKKAVLTANYPGARAFDATAPYKIYRFPRALFSLPMPPFPRIYLLKVLLSLPYAISVCMREKPDYLIAGQLLPDGVLCHYLSKVLHVPYAVQTYDTIDVEMPLHTADAAICRLVMRGADRVFYISDFMRGKAIDAGAMEERAVKAEPGTDPEFFRPHLGTSALRKKHGLDGKKVLLTVAKLSERKGHAQVIRALPRVLEKFPELVYLMAGSGKCEAELRGLADSLGVSGNVIFLGSVGNAELPLYYNLCDIFIMPSFYIAEKFKSEGYGIVFLEANACGKPVIGGRNAGMLDAVADGKTGLLVEPSNVEEISSAIVKLLSNPSLARRMGNAGRERVLNERNWENSAKAVSLAIFGGSA
ncbi:MAG: glycosyltransferase family 4 protein [Candidatus Diapherotrites archaeon]